MATSKKSAVATKVAAGFPAKSAPVPANVAAAAEALKAAGAAKKPTRAKKAVASPVEVAGKALAEASTKPMRAKAATKPARPPAVLAKSGKLLGADPKGVPGTKAKPGANRTERLADSGIPSHDVHDVTSLVKVLGDFPRGSTFDIMDDHFDIYNLRSRLIATVRKVAKPVKGAKK